jgi:hypothetical protein
VSMLLVSGIVLAHPGLLSRVLADQDPTTYRISMP